ncbi:MAG: hypothetical protein H6867_06980 [Rhodospirillales bacterium]|nr:hypothetical protein [Rhodospirillales bacterium]MCB9995293.1 hypothetical protein [Rhodospirillales bacterium]
MGVATYEIGKSDYTEYGKKEEPRRPTEAFNNHVDPRLEPVVPNSDQLRRERSWHPGLGNPANIIRNNM